MKEADSKTKREPNFELLRIVSMIMVVALHYWGKSGFLDRVPASDPGFYVGWFSESLCICAVNCFVLLTGYFMSEKKFKLSRIIRIWLQVLEYSVILYLVSILTGLNTFSGLDLAKAFFPISNETYWFATKYLILLVISPFLNLLMDNCDKKRMGILFVSSFILFSVMPSVFYWKDYLNIARGYSVLWFVCLYIFGAYVKRFGIPLFKSKGGCFLGFFLSVFVIFAARAVFGLINCYRGSEIPYAKVLYNYNFVFTFLSALFLFGFFMHLSVKNEAAKKVIFFLSPASFGVYLLHLNTYSVNWFWRRLLKPDSIGNAALIAAHHLVVVFGVYLLCAMAERIRLWLLEDNPLMRKLFERIDRRGKNEV